MMSSKKTRIHLLLMPRILNQKNPISLVVKDSTIQYKGNDVGASLGGWLTYNFYQNKIQSSEVIIGLTGEIIPTNVLKENKTDSISITGLGLSLGIHTWFNTFNKLNFGLRAVYTYSTYDSSKYLAKPIGGHSLTFSLIYRFPRRRNENKSNTYTVITSSDGKSICSPTRKAEWEGIHINRVPAPLTEAVGGLMALLANKSSSGRIG